jgi:amino acid transporter
MADDDKKPWYRSKTMWVNIIAGLALLIQLYSGFIIGPEEQTAIIIVINLILRAITGKGLTIKKSS